MFFRGVSQSFTKESQRFTKSTSIAMLINTNFTNFHRLIGWLKETKCLNGLKKLCFLEGFHKVSQRNHRDSQNQHQLQC
jgi:hypothetical protein